MTDQLTATSTAQAPDERPDRNDERPDVSVVELERELGLFLRRAHSASAGMARGVHPDLEPAAYELLAIIAGSPSTVRASDLAAHIGVGRGTMSRQLSRLLSLGLIQRRPDPGDFRGQLLSLTDEGRARLDAARASRRTYLVGALAGWTSDDVLRVAHDLGRLNAALASAREGATAVAAARV
ncbi:MarR family winged helix-turn-helix transcriptional regulator [Cellulomonas sp. HZM]|uniref:MarR family winged helix-turn-helix transcriptional regulator n=1 Tax=Cellulomonas sp. HZM TaxID=1454010 RepID=UPI001E31D53D|nr:MarR family transcriptional regulator [Cellulomonas sp. HZM]